ncbi:MAG: alpha/beta fold hydrolase [Gemmatimonadaceae bacterium]
MFLALRHLEIGYDDIGTGPAVLLVHGFPLNRQMWQPQLGAFVGRCRMIAPDLRGFGGSRGTGPYGMDVYADDLAAFIDALELPRVVVVGLSMGGYIALAFWRRHRARVRGLVLADTRAGADDDDARERRRGLQRMAREEGVAAVADTLLRGLVGKSTRETHPEIVNAVRALMLAAPADGVVGGLEAMITRPDSAPTLATIDVPTLVIVGDEDVVTPAAEARTMHAAIPGSRLEILAGAGHMSNYERPAAFNHVLAEFVGRLEYA